ncbi:MAG TPA: hypothetical protein VF142_16250, partial [Longimicrobium sp.]
MPDSSQQAMQSLTAQWYNTVTTGLGLDPNTFQLIQTNQPLGTTTEQLWSAFDALPPLSVTNYFNPTQFNSFAQSYGSVVMNLQPTAATAFLKIMGDSYAQWAAYNAANPPVPPQTPLDSFTAWAYRNISNPATQSAAITAFKQTLYTVPGIATNMYINGMGSPAFAYTTTYAQLQVLLASAPSKTVDMNSSTASSDVSHTWAQGAVGGAYSIFSGSASGSYDQLSQQFASSQVTVHASFNSVLQLAAGPLAQGSQDPTLSKYAPWYYAPAMNLAYQNNNNIVWNNNPPTWEQTFGPSGNMQRVCSALIIVDGIDITVTSQANFSQSDQQSFQAAAKAGFWPFFSVSASGGSSSSTSFGSDGSVTVTSSMPAGNPQVFGVIVTPIS